MTKRRRPCGTAAGARSNGQVSESTVVRGRGRSLGRRPLVVLASTAPYRASKATAEGLHRAGRSPGRRPAPIDPCNGNPQPLVPAIPSAGRDPQRFAPVPGQVPASLANTIVVSLGCTDLRPSKSHAVHTCGRFRDAFKNARNMTFCKTMTRLDRLYYTISAFWPTINV